MSGVWVDGAISTSVVSVVNNDILWSFWYLVWGCIGVAFTYSAETASLRQCKVHTYLYICIFIYIQI